MEADKNLLNELKRKMLSKYPRFGSEIAVANIEYRTNLKYHTAATDGKNVYVDPNYIASLSEDDRLFLIAHQIMHIKFMHAYRLTDKEGNRRDPEIWSTATDAIINANLERDGFKIKDGYVNKPEALKYSAEEFYEILLKEKEEKQNSQNEQSNQDYQSNPEKDGEQKKGNSSQEQENNSNGNYSDDHSLWEKAFENRQKNGKKRKSGSKSNSNEETKYKSQSFDKSSQIEFGYDEKNEFEDNRKEKIENFQRRREQKEREIRGEQSNDSTIQLGNVGESKDSIDWKLLTRREIEKSETIWSQRRSIAENNYAYRLEENDIDEDAETEVMIDVSGSVDLDLVKAFLRELKPLLKQSKLRVGCFNEKFWGMVDIKSIKDIDNFVIPANARGSSAWTEDWDLAVRSFTKKREINKIVFTDGYPEPGTMPKEDLRKENVIWLVYGNKDFKPCCGKVINITEKQLGKLHQQYNKTFNPQEL